MTQALVLEMGFPDRLVALRKQRGFTQRALAEKVGVRALQIGRYENGIAQPTLEVIRNLAKALGVRADDLIFDKAERGPDEDLRLQFEPVSRMSAAEKRVVKELIEGMILKHEARRWASGEAQ
jgi:transcriptional regulator with XRE-family HTH domain